MKGDTIGQRVVIEKQLKNQNNEASVVQRLG